MYATLINAQPRLFF